MASYIDRFLFYASCMIKKGVNFLKNKKNVRRVLKRLKKTDEAISQIREHNYLFDGSLQTS